MNKINKFKIKTQSETKLNLETNENFSYEEIQKEFEQEFQLDIE